jgi:hypothetical protein
MSTATVALVRNAVDDIKIIIIFFKSFGAKKVNELATSKKLTDTVAGLVTSGLGSDEVRVPSFGPHWSVLLSAII